MPPKLDAQIAIIKRASAINSEVRKQSLLNEPLLIHGHAPAIGQLLVH